MTCTHEKMCIFILNLNIGVDEEIFVSYNISHFFFIFTQRNHVIIFYSMVLIMLKIAYKPEVCQYHFLCSIVLITAYPRLSSSWQVATKYSAKVCLYDPKGCNLS